MAVSTSEVLDSLVPISQFNKGQASRIFDRLKTQRQMIVLKNNEPTAVILSLEEYNRLAELEEDYHLLVEAVSRMQENAGKPGLSIAESMAEFGITEDDLESMEEPILE